ncbi:MAG TPA: NUDIX hydrolase [Actinomycetota bacterium]|nr:NUDIX hydrolase [Actinomycetota bacterium]
MSPAAGGAGGESRLPEPVRPTEVEEVFAGPLFRVEVQRWFDPNRRRDVVRHPGSAAVLVLTGEGNVILVRQLREAVGERLLEAPAGIFDREQEPGHELARRELEEETGYRATRLEHLGTIYTSPGFTDEAIELFLAEAEPGGQPEEGIEMVAMEFGEAVAAVVDGRIRDAKTALAILLARARIT